MKKLDEAIKLLEAGWCKGSEAKTADGRNVPVEHPEAVCFCAVGALRKTGQIELSSTLARRVRFTVLWAWNDMPSRTKEEVIALFRQVNEEGE